jgi:hypothetical protein
MDSSWVKRKNCKVLLQDSTLVVLKLFVFVKQAWFPHRNVGRLVGVGDVLQCAVEWGEFPPPDADRDGGQIL